MILLMEELTAANLLEHLGNQTFVEYFNAFLLLPAFNHRAFYNSELGLFEEVAVPQKTSTVGSIPHAASPASSCSLILTDDNFVATLDKQQSWLWVVKERLPLFVRSDLYSQYKLCKILSSPSPKLVTVEAFSKILPTLGAGHQRQSSFPDCLPSSFGKLSAAGGAKTLSPTVLTENRDLDYSLLDSKVSMGQFRRFLRGTVGEKYWFFWLDVERARYLSKPTEQMRLLRELRDKYLKAGGNFEIPPETRNRMGIPKLSKLSMNHLDDIQRVLTDGLKNYWCARFLLHYKLHVDESSSHIRSQTSYAYPLQQSSRKQLSSTTSPQSAGSRAIPISHDFSKNEHGAQKLPSSSKSEKKSLLPEVIDKQTGKTSSASDTRLSKKPLSATTVKASVSDQQLTSAKTPKTAAGGCPPHSSKTEHQRVPSRDNRTLRYTSHHLPQLSSRGPSALSLQSATNSTVFSSSLVTDSSCQILSVSGTPLPSAVSVEIEIEYRSLLKFLSIEQRKAGGVFQRFLEDKNDQQCLNCLMFWRELQNFKKLFVQPRFNPCAVDMVAKGLFGKYIAEMATDSIGCSVVIKQKTHTMLEPAYEDLFDLAEEHTLKCLLAPWIEMSNDDSDMFRKMERAQNARRQSAFCKECSGGLQELDEESDFFGDDLSEESLPNVMEDTASNVLTDVAKKPWALADMLQNGIELEYFKIFLNEQFAAQDLMCWMEIEQFRALPIADKKQKDIKARQIRKQYFNQQYFFGPQSPANKQQQLEVVSAGGGVYGQKLPLRPSSAVLREAQKHVRARLEKKWLPMFLETPDFKQRHLTIPGDGRKSSVHSPTGNKTGELHWMANSLEAILFRRALQDHDNCANFVQYLAIKEEPDQFLVNNVIFWLEVQRYKEMCHGHTLASMLDGKMRAIINCFLLSPVPPKLQLNIPQDIADKVNRKDPTGPYVFREAQASVFKDLFSYWVPFQTFCAGHDPKNLPFNELAEETKERREGMIRKEVAYEQYIVSKRQATPRFETETEKRKRLREEAIAKEMASVAIAFKLSEPSPLYKTAIAKESSNPESIKILTPIVQYTDEKAAKTNFSPNTPTAKPSPDIKLTRRPQTTKNIKKTIEITHARPTTSPVRKVQLLFPSVSLKLPSAKCNTLQVPTINNSTSKDVTGNRIIFETHTEKELETLAMPKSKRLVKMQFSSGSSNFRYAEGLERNSVITSLNT